MCIMSIVRILKKPIHTENSLIDKGKVFIMNKEIKLANLKKTCKVFAVISRILEIVSYVGAAISAVSIIALFAGSEYLGVKIDGADQLDSFFLVLKEHFNETTAWVIFLVILTVLLLLSGLVIRKVGDLFRNINKEYSPFVPENVRLIKVIAVIFAVVTLIEIGVIPAVMTGFVIWAIALLFDYGCELQNESDEIL